MAYAGTRLRGFVAAMGWTTEVAAREIGCERSYVSLLQTGRRRPSLRVAVAIEKLSATWEHGPIRPDEWLRPAPPSTAAAELSAAATEGSASDRPGGASSSGLDPLAPVQADEAA